MYTKRMDACLAQQLFMGQKSSMPVDCERRSGRLVYPHSWLKGMAWPLLWCLGSNAARELRAHDGSLYVDGW